MTGQGTVNLRWTVVVAAAAGLLATGAATTYLLLQRSSAGDRPGETASSRPPSPPAAPPTDVPTPDLSMPEIVVTLSKEAVDRAGITVAPVGAGRAGTDLRLSGVVEPNAYRQVTVTPLVSGRVTHILVELGQRVREGQTMARVFSPELVEAHARYVAASAELDAHDRALQRTQKLVEIGAASRQELEQAHAEHSAQTAAVESARARLELLGAPPAALDRGATGSLAGSTNVPAPMSGIVTERAANVGLNVDPSAKLFTVVDLSTVWVTAAVYERDFARVRVGSPTVITTSAYPDLVLKGKVAYVDPQVNAETRTANVRVEVPNAGNALRLGMYADVTVGGLDASAVPVIPRSAVQHVGEREVVYLVDPAEPGEFTERPVRLGRSTGDQVEVLSGLSTGDVIVTGGSFFLRAERERMGVRAKDTPAAPNSESPPSGPKPAPEVQTARITVGDSAFEPSRLQLRAGVPARITFVRTSDKTCGTEVVFPSLKIKRSLPLNEPIVIDITPTNGELLFTCGMNMLRGTIVGQPR
jgi:membrane fusion protein, heavy metal efflux system